MNNALKGLGVLGFVALITGYGCFGPPGTVACGNATGFAPAILESVEHCPQAIEKLGTPVSFGMLGVGCGNYEAGGDSAGEGVAYGDGLPVRGAKGSATADYSISKGGGVWTPSKLVLTFSDGSKLDIGACSASYQAARGDEAIGATLQKQCDEGLAATCEALALRLESKGKTAEAKEMKAKACKLGLSSACAGVEPQK